MHKNYCFYRFDQGRSVGSDPVHVGWQRSRRAMKFGGSLAYAAAATTTIGVLRKPVRTSLVGLSRGANYSDTSKRHSGNCSDLC